MPLDVRRRRPGSLLLPVGRRARVWPDGPLRVRLAVFACKALGGGCGRDAGAGFACVVAIFGCKHLGVG